MMLPTTAWMRAALGTAGPACWPARTASRRSFASTIAVARSVWTVSDIERQSAHVVGLVAAAGPVEHPATTIVTRADRAILRIVMIFLHRNGPTGSESRTVEARSG